MTLKEWNNDEFVIGVVFTEPLMISSRRVESFLSSSLDSWTDTFSPEWGLMWWPPHVVTTCSGCSPHVVATTCCSEISLGAASLWACSCTRSLAGLMVYEVWVDSNLGLGSLCRLLRFVKNLSCWNRKEQDGTRWNKLEQCKNVYLKTSS